MASPILGDDGGKLPILLLSTFPNCYQQIIYKKMLEIAARFPKPKKYQEAAQHFRLPYWDYFRPRGWDCEFPGVTQRGGTMTKASVDFDIPKIFTMDKVMVRTPAKDERFLMQNPLRCYTFPDGVIPETHWEAQGARVLGFDSFILCRLTMLRGFPGAHESSYPP